MQRIAELDPAGEWLASGRELRRICLPGELTTDTKTGAVGAQVGPQHLKQFYTDGLLDPLRRPRTVLAKLKVALGYTASRRDCGPCPHKPTCAPNIKKRQLIRTAYAAHYQRALTRQQSRHGHYMRQLRQRAVEPVFGSLLQHYGLRRVNTRGRSSAHKTMLLAAIAFNLKKLLKPQLKRALRLAVALPILLPVQRFLSC